MGPKSKYHPRLSHLSKDLEGIIPSCTGEKLLCANEIEELLGVQNRKFNLTSKFSSATVANVTEPKGSSLLTLKIVKKYKVHPSQYSLRHLQILFNQPKT